MVQILCSRVFCGELFTVNLRTKKELCDVRVRRILQLNDSTESHGTCSVDVATLPDGTSADTILASCSVELLFSSSSENVRAILCVVAAKQRLNFVAATVAGTAEVLPAVLFLGSLYEESQMRACTVVPSEPAVKVKGASELKEAFTDNTTAVCTASGTLLVLERGRCLHRCQLPFTDSMRITCGLRPDSEGHLVVWASTGGVALLGLSSDKQLQARQAALHKTRRALAQCEALLEEAVEVITARQLGGIAESRLQDACGHLVPVLPSGQMSPICPLPEETSASESVMLLHSWAHIWGPQLLLGWVFQRPLSMRTQPPTFLASPGITFGVRASMDPKRVTIASSCRLPAEPTLRVALVAGPLRHHQTIVLDEVRTVNLQDPRTTGVQVAKEVVASQRAAQEVRCFRLDSVPVATANELLLGLFDRVAPGLYVCCEAFSPLLRASADLFEEQSGALCLSLYAEDAAQHELLKRRLVCRFPGDVGWTPCSSREEDERLASALREEARLASALADQPERYVSLRRELQEAEWQTDFLAQGFFDRQASATNRQ
ncbi:hypothetical protein IscW_ISCW008172 [Ixodes scapularis]|uniref:Uncharacterized protein n=1 Tax=Ixodes scapularis TaxID=6945 RepID=B7PS83_IXOSC|nr:hypothetical protein IscW_ISCW008172 [Ixodes scapularis]|eukprot:XP_002402070.1 hypothetical protein IscW_ISCW008172 [Ixodes scapularis]